MSARGRPHSRKVEPPPHGQLKGPDNLYPFSSLDFKPVDVKNTYQGIIGPLSIFAPHSNGKESIEIAPPETARPTTPINDEIRSAPSTFDKLVKHIRRRISARPLPHMSEDDQKELAGIVIGELTVVWPHLRSPVSHSLLNEEQNKELQRRVVVHIVSGSERLFHEHVNKLQVLNRRGIFSGTANMTRLKAQLALKTSNMLNLSSLRRKILEDFKVERKIENVLQSHEKYPKVPAFKRIGDATRFITGMQLDSYRDYDPHIQELMSKMPNLDTSGLQKIMASLPVVRTSINRDENVRTDSPTVRKLDAQEVAKSEQDFAVIKTQRAMSMPQIGPHEKLLEELSHSHDFRLPAKPESVTDDGLSFLAMHAEKPASTTKQTMTPREDLARLMERNEAGGQLQHQLADDDLPPLIRALPRNAKHDGKHALIMKQLKELEERENARIEEETIDVHEPKYDQPETVTATANKMTVKTSDIRVSDRVCLSSITMKGHETVYNDLIDEITAEDVKKLDSNLFLGDEIKEVYAEIMKTVPTDHLRLDQDDLIEPAADSVNLSSTFTSSTLRGRKEDRVINPNLQHSNEPPWGDHSVTTWANMPSNLGRTETADAGELVQPTSAPNGEEGPQHVQDFMARTYASWLMWWKNTINSDDYMKYLSTQETDYLGVVFHFYNSDAEEEEEDDDDDSKARQASRIQAQQERETKLTELRAQKESYEAGYWNANSVLLGGLGKDPLLGDEFADDDKSLANTVATGPLKTARGGTTVVPLSQMHASMQAAEAGNVSFRNIELDTTRDTQAGTQSMASRGASRRTTKSKPASGPKPQDRLEKVWTALQMPDNLRLDMAIKYSSDAYFNKLDLAIAAWEEITEVINKRENILADLEAFERTASDPNRFFEKGQRGSSVARLDEARMRSNLYKKIDTLDEKIKSLIQVLEEDFMDTVTFKGRLYSEKIKWDRVEMLYWLQEERKQALLDMRPHRVPLTMPHLVNDLDPIPSASPSIMTGDNIYNMNEINETL